MSGARGRALGALLGHYPEPAIGLPPAAGLALWDDFTAGAGALVANRYGDLFWRAGVTGAAGTIKSVTPTADTEVGILEVSTGTTSADAVDLHRGTGTDRPFYLYPPVGSIWAAKLNLSGTATNYELWSGFKQLATGTISGATSCDFLGVRAVAGNLFGVARNATAETTVDLGFNCHATWRSVGFEVTDDGVQFFYLTLTERHLWVRTDVGDPVTTNLPNQATYPSALGIGTSTGAARTAQVDWWSLGGRIAR